MTTGWVFHLNTKSLNVTIFFLVQRWYPILPGTQCCCCLCFCCCFFFSNISLSFFLSLAASSRGFQDFPIQLTTLIWYQLKVSLDMLYYPWLPKQFISLWAIKFTGPQIDTFSYSSPERWFWHRNWDLIVQAKCLLQRPFACTAKPYLLWKIRKHSKMVSVDIFTQLAKCLDE